MTYLAKVFAEMTKETTAEERRQQIGDDLRRIRSGEMKVPTIIEKQQGGRFRLGYNLPLPEIVIKKNDVG